MDSLGLHLSGSDEDLLGLKYHQVIKIIRQDSQKCVEDVYASSKSKAQMSAFRSAN